MTITTKPKLKADVLYTLAVDVRYHDELYREGIQLLGDDELVQDRPECFSAFSLGYRGVIAAREALEAANLEEQRQRRARAEAAAPPEEKPAMVVAIKSFTDRGVVVEPGELWRADHPTVLAAANAFAPVQD